MHIITANQYNQAVSKYKLLSATAGVGSIITTKLGYYILISDINKWRFIESAQREITRIKEDSDESEWYDHSKKRIEDLGISVIDDPRFVEFLKNEKELENLLCLLAIPHLSINEFFNTVNVKNNPIIQELRARGLNVSVEDFMIFGTHFPKWFKNRKGELQQYHQWKELWRSHNKKLKYFTPPRDVKDPIKNARGEIVKRKVKDPDGVEEEIKLFHELTQTNLVLICPNGHLSDIPWPNFLRWKTEKLTGARSRTDNGEDLFNIDPCCSTPKLKWTESTTRSEGYGSIFIECENCKFGTGIES